MQSAVKVVRSYVVKVFSQSRNAWRAVTEKSLQACLALVDGLTTDYRIVTEDKILLAVVNGAEQTRDKSINKPFRDYRYLQSKRTSSNLQSRAVRSSCGSGKHDNWKPVRQALQSRATRLQVCQVV